MMLSRIALGAAVALLSTSVMAADLIIDEPAAVIPTSAFDWSGFYVGAHAGWATGSVLADPIDAPDETTATGWLLGVQAGANAQFDTFVLGVEGDIAWTNITNEDEILLPAYGLTDVNWLASLRGRAGVAFDQVLLYATAGIAGAGVTFNDLDAAEGSLDGTHFGWTAGIGAEVAITETISAKVEYLYYDFGAVTYDLGDPDDVSFNLHTIKAGLNFHF